MYTHIISVTTGSAIEKNGSMYVYVRLEEMSILTYMYVYMLPFVSIALPVVTLAHASY